MTAQSTEAPAYIERDTYAGRYSIHRPVAKVRADYYTAAEIAALAPTGVIPCTVLAADDGEFVIRLSDGREGRVTAGELYGEDESGRYLGGVGDHFH